MDEFDIDIDSTGFLDFSFDYEGNWDDPSMGIVTPVVGVPDEHDDGPQPLLFGPGSTAQ